MRDGIWKIYVEFQVDTGRSIMNVYPIHEYIEACCGQGEMEHHTSLRSSDHNIFF